MSQHALFKVAAKAWVYVKTRKKAPSDKYSAFTMLLFLFTPQIRGEHLLQGAYVLVEFQMCTEFWMLVGSWTGRRIAKMIAKPHLSLLLNETEVDWKNQY